MANPNVLRRILLAFSWRRNFEILFSDSPKYCITEVIETVGLRVFCLSWILLVHVCTVLYYVSGKKQLYKPKFVWKKIKIDYVFLLR